MLTEERVAKYNLIIEAASDLVNLVVLAIKNPADPGHRADWLARYGAIADLNLLTSLDGLGYLEATPEHPDRYPYAMWFIDQVAPDPGGTGEECFLASLGCEIGVIGETFAMAQRELFEIQHALRSILLHDKSLGDISELGGLVDHVRWTGFREPRLLRDDMQRPVLEVDFYYEIAFREMVYR